MKKSIGQLAALALTAGLAVVIPHDPASAAERTVVSIKAELDVPSIEFDPGVPSGPRTFEVTDVTAGDQVELTGSDETSNPSEYCGTISVDVDPVSKRITVGPDVAAPETCDFETVRVTVLSSSVAGAAYVSGDLFETGSAEAVQFTRTVTPVSGGVEILWQTTTEAESLDTAGIEQFTYTPPAPPAPARFTLAKPLKVTGKTKAGHMLRVTPVRTAISPAPKNIKIQWFRGATRIPGAQHPTYRVRKADIGKQLKVRIKVTGSAPTRIFVVKAPRRILS
ncbi:MAG: hypothetical protein JWN84_1241 [Nocardioides sp.]|nr:hypothetical protein [Nocardioides sp.]